VTTKKKSTRKKSTSRKTSSRGEPKSMAELLQAYGGAPKGLTRGQKVKGKVTEKSSKRLLLDIEGKGEGLVAEKAFDEAKSFIKGLEVGDEVITEVIVAETPDGFTILSLRKAAQETAWEKLKEAKKKKKAIGVLAKGVNPSGVVVDVVGLTGFIPGSQLSKQVSKNPSELVGKNFKAQVLELDRLTNKIILSEKAESEGEDMKLASRALKKIKKGGVYKGRVVTVAGFGCFVEIKEKIEGKKVPIEGLVHVSELSWGKIEKPSDVISEGEEVVVKVIDTADGKLSLSFKQAQKDPWEEVEKKYKKEAKVKGKVIRRSDFGIFVELEPGVEGLIHMTKIPPGEKFEEGQEVNVYLEEIDGKKRKISLGLILTRKPIGYK
jgi:ribosomal protein S1